MQDFGQAFAEAFRRLAALDPDLVEIVALSLKVSLSAVLLACLIGLPLGAVLAVTRFPGRAILATFVAAMMGLPPVVVSIGVLYLGFVLFRRFRRKRLTNRGYQQDDYYQ